MRANKKTPKKSAEKDKEGPARPDIGAHPKFHGFGKTDMKGAMLTPTGTLKKVKF